MSLLMPNSGESVALSYLVGKTTSVENLVLKLYTNNQTPGESDTAGSYTEASGAGYSPITLSGSSWTVTAGNPTTATYPQQTVTFTGAASAIYGYFIVGATTGTLMWAEKFSDGPYSIANANDAIRISLSISLD